jgi:hypothetical protein
MERVHLILNALASNPANAEDGGSDAARTAHAEVKGLVLNHFGGNADANSALEQYEENPDEGRERLKEILGSTGAVEDFDIIVAAQNLMKLVDPEGSAAGKYAVPPRRLPGGLSIGH